MNLTIELVPQTAWLSNVRSGVSKRDWDRLRNKCFKEAHSVCEICGGKGHKWPVECHEIWHYDDINKKQTLKGLIALCPKCHQAKHAGLAELRGKIETVISQLMKVNNISKPDAINYFNESKRVHRERSKHEWDLDVSFLESYL